MAEKTNVRVSSYLSPPDLHRLDWTCVPIHRAFDKPPYLVGSALTRPSFRDIDLRMILSDEDVMSMFGAKRLEPYGTNTDPEPNRLWLLINIALSDLIAKTAGLSWPIDFQIQSRAEANKYTNEPRNPMGVR